MPTYEFLTKKLMIIYEELNPIIQDILYQRVNKKLG